MKKKLSIISTLIIVALMLIFNLLIFMKEDWIIANEKVFWTIWSFTFPVNLLVIIGVFIYNVKSEADEIIKAPVFILLSIVEVLYFAVAVVFLYLIKVKLPFILILEFVVTLIAVILFLYAYGAISYIFKQQKHVKQKVFYIRNLAADLESCVIMCKDQEVKKHIKKLQEDIRFSDPMSHESLHSIEINLEGLVNEIVIKVSSNDLEGIFNVIDNATNLLNLRNNKCKLLK